MKGRDGAPGRQIRRRDRSTSRLRPDGVARRGVRRAARCRLDLPASADAPARSISARHVRGTGEAGKGLTTTRLHATTSSIREAGSGGAAARVARSQSLTRWRWPTTRVATRRSRERVTFEEDGLQASRGARLDYEPARARCGSSGADARGGRACPTIRSRSTREHDRRRTRRQRHDRRSGDVKTTLRPQNGSASPRARAAAAASRSAGLLRRTRSPNVNADALDYDGAAGKAVYRAARSLWQGDTAIRADTISLDQQNGDLDRARRRRARTLVLDTGARSAAPTRSATTTPSVS